MLLLLFLFEEDGISTDEKPAVSGVLEEEEALVLGVDTVLPGVGTRNFPFKEE